ncbi:rho GTPase-activating protein 15 isoform X2 [Aplysia californica]|uniref:Rho GTPase-activating protein 15 isoform X2 n=1 Tax=Aplysia californica TaxID=6500 RepID=A0ABM1A4H8_APLCA|nr:rho GTPase-activating protein 15 isoform X2 [Aplysia californica]
MSEEVEDVVRVLYDYGYTDDSGQVTIKAGDLYRLVERTNNEWWQVYDPSDANGDCFFVPAQYVEVVSERSPLKTLSDLDKLLTFGESARDSPLTDYDDDREQTYANQVNRDNESDYVNSSSSHGEGETDGEYVNLEQYRNVARINPITVSACSDDVPGTSKNSSLPSPTAQELIQGTIPPPLPEEGTFVRVLVEGLPWDIYKEHSLQRLYYVNRETGERMWKPPRKDKPSSGEQPKPVVPITPPSLPTVSEKKGTEWSIPSEYEQVHDNGNLYFIHKSTQEKWKSLVDQVGRQYFHKMGSSDTRWNLPASAESSENPSDSAAPDLTTIQIRPRLRQKDSNWESQGHRLSTFGAQSMRAVKAMSTYGQLESSSSKASTLPANFSAPRPAPIANDRLPVARPVNLAPPSPSTLPQVPEGQQRSTRKHREIFSGYLNKTKIAELGKKKSKKNWSQTFVVLQGSNLVFYKDQKSAPQKPGSPHGKPEGVISLQGAHVDFNPSKDITSKKNTILLYVSSGSSFLFQSDNEKTIREWFTRMKIVANDVSPAAETSPKEFDLKEDRKGMTRSVSADESPSLHSVDKNKNIVSIRAKLLNFISRRPAQEDLVKRGIIKDAVFGSLLHELCDREKVPVPKFVHQCVAAVESRGLTHDGLYRVSGNLAEIQRLRCAVDKDDSYNLYDRQWDVHVLTGALKLFFRELKEPVFPFHMYNRFFDAVRKEPRKEKMHAFKSAVSDLPRCNYFTLKELFQHLCKVIEVSHENRMQTQNVAIVFGPTLLWYNEDAASLAVQTVVQSKIVEFMLTEYSELFKS